jgi:hypothetical protein
MRGFYVAFIFLLGLAGCNQEDIDDQKPVIDLSVDGAFPKSCDTLYLGEPFTWRARFTDNVELGSCSLDIHHNFDHHSHSTEVETCDLDPIKDPVNPFHTIMDFEIPAGSKDYTVNREISLPLTDGNSEFDAGDYHFFISLTDREGWSVQKGLSIKILKKEEG